MGKMTGLERVLKALKLQEPDVVPHFEHVNKKVRDAILPDASYEDFIEFMDIDGIRIGDSYYAWSYETVDEAKKIKRDQWGGLVRYTTEDGAIPIEPAIKSQGDLDKYKPPDPDEEWRYEFTKEVVKSFKGERAIVPYVRDIFAMCRENFLGHTGYFKAMLKDPDFIDHANEILLDYQLRYMKNCIDLGADAFFINGDWAMQQGPMASPELIQRFVVPPFRKMVECAHSRGVPIIKHTDGNIWSIFDIIVDAGADCIHPIDPMAGMDIGKVKIKFGDRICLYGNVSCAFTLVTGTVEEVRQETREVIRKAGKGGGLICASSNSIHSGVKPENYVAMVKEIKEYGQYPLALK